MFAGVLGGIGEYFRIDPSILRVIYASLMLFTGLLPLLLAYLIAMLFIPMEPYHRPKMPYKKLYRSKTNRKIAGVVGGLSYFINVDATLLRVIVALVTFFTGVLPGIIIYVIAWNIIPEIPANQDVEIDIIQ